MNRETFFSQVRGLRKWLTHETPQDILDRMVENVTGGKQGDKVSTELDLEKDVARVIKRIKEAKEEEKVNAKAKDLIEQIKKSLDD